MASGSIHKHTAADGRVTWRVRVDMTNPSTDKRECAPASIDCGTHYASKGNHTLTAPAALVHPYVLGVELCSKNLDAWSFLVL